MVIVVCVEEERRLVRDERRWRTLDGCKPSYWVLMKIKESGGGSGVNLIVDVGVSRSKNNVKVLLLNEGAWIQFQWKAVRQRWRRPLWPIMMVWMNLKRYLCLI